jgi:hypothetical protein
MVAMIIWCVVLVKDFKMPIVYEELKAKYDEIIEKHNQEKFKSKMLRLTISIQHLNKNDKVFKEMEE